MAGGKGGGYYGGQGAGGYEGNRGGDGGGTYNGATYGGGGGGGAAGGGTGGDGTYSDGTVTGAGGTAGQAGADTTTAGVGGGGGGGGGANGTLANGFTGGAGGKGGQGNYGGGGGAGGYGYVTGATPLLPNAGTITGGAGGDGGAGVNNPNGGLSGYGGSGGDGGAGVFVTGAMSTFTNTADGTITGGNGGAGGSGNAAVGAGGAGGAGIGGVGGITIDNSGTVTGGAGGAGAFGGFFGNAAAAGGGAGIAVTGSTVTNTGGKITGGTGGTGGDGVDGGDGSSIHNVSGSIIGGDVDEGAPFGAAGAGIVVGETSSVVVDGGSVSGGMGSGFIGGVGGAGVIAGATSSVTVNGGTVDGGSSTLPFGSGAAGIVASKASVTGGAVTGGSGGTNTFFSSQGTNGGAGITDSQSGGGEPDVKIDAASTPSTFNVSGGTVTGGAGGAGLAGSQGNQGGSGGYGGAGISGTGTITGNGTITGGSGGQGGSSDTGTGGRGGNGGYGISANYSTVTTSGTVAGGAGGAGGDSTSGNQGTGGGGGAGIAGYGSSVTVQNGGSVTGGAGGNTGAGNSDGTIFGGFGGTGVYGSALTLASDGTIAGGKGGDGNYAGFGGYGIDAGSASFVTTNAGSVTGGDSGAGTLQGGSGGIGVAGSDLTLVTNGTISGGMGSAGSPPIEEAAFTSTRLAAIDPASVQADAVRFTGGSNTLALGSNAQFNGAIDLYNGSSVTFDQNVVDGLPADASVSTNIIGSGSVIKFGDGTLTFSGTANTYSGGTTISAGTLDLASKGAAGSGAIAFRAASSSGTRLDLEMSAQNVGGRFGNTLSYFDAGDSLDLKGFAFNSMSATITPVNNSFVVMDAMGNTQTFDLSRSTTKTYYAHDDGNGGTLIDTNMVCFVTGTRIRTMRGACAVEDLVVGDVAVTASGDVRPIVWIGHRDIDCGGRYELHPVRVAAHAFGADLPARDLWLSPGHPVLVGADEGNEGGHLVPIMCLVNGTTIARVPVDAVTYWHVELDVHDILLAEDLPAESYLDWGDRGFFREGSDHRIENPDFVAPGLAGRCRPVALDGPVVEAARDRLDTVFATRLVGACAWPAFETDALDV